MADKTVLIRNLPSKTEFNDNDCTVIDDGVTTSKICLGTVQEQIRNSVHESTKAEVDKQLAAYDTTIQEQFKTQNDNVTKQLTDQNTLVETNLTTLDEKVQDSIIAMKNDVANEIKAITLPLVVRGGKLCCITKEIK